MKNILIDQIKKIREATGLSVNDVKNALTEANGDEDKAMELLRQRGMAIADKKSSRSVKDGIVVSYIHSNKKLGSLVELFCETDFVARSQEYQALGLDLAMQIAAMKPDKVEDLLEQEFIKDSTLTVRDLIQKHIAKLGENIQIGQFVYFEI